MTYINAIYNIKIISHYDAVIRQAVGDCAAAQYCWQGTREPVMTTKKTINPDAQALIDVLAARGLTVNAVARTAGISEG
ncbi:MAG: hypothetical protein HN527_11675, partial [Rhodospirillaceae bacterium]|nr:hypothetical protein [Rhodospirillaceae bacterium]